MRHWIAAARPRTLPAGLVPVLVAGGLASTVTQLDYLALAACLGGALLIQIGCNFGNDAFDARRGADGPGRVGPQRAVAAGLVSERAMLLAAAFTLTIALLIGLYLSYLGGWPIFVLGLISIVCALAYTGGPFPLAYHGLGDLFVLAFFGFFAVLGSAWIQVAPDGVADPDLLGMPAWWWLVAAALGLQAAGILTVNNIRDRDGDAAVGKRTMAVRLGPRGSRCYLLLLHLSATGSLAAAAQLAQRPWLLLVAAVAALGGAALALAVWRQSGAALNRYLARSAGLELLTGFGVVAICML